MQAMVLAAGLGTRLWPLTSDRAKPAVPFLGRPLIRGVVELLEKHGIDTAVVNTHYLPDSIHRALASATPAGVRILFSHELEILGTAGGLARALAHGLLDPARATLVINAKLHTDLDLSAAMRAHARSGAAVTMVLRPNAEREQFREVEVEGDRVIGFGEGRSPKGLAPLLFTGIHILEPEVLRSIPLAPCDTVNDVYPPLIRDRRVAAHVDASGRWWEFSTLERYLALHIRAAEEGIGPEVSLSEGASIEALAEVRRSVLWEGAHVGRGAIVEDTVLGRDVIVPSGAIVRRAVIVRREVAGDDAARGERIFHDQVRVPLAP